MAMAVDHRHGVGGGRRSGGGGYRMMKAVPVPDLCAIFTLSPPVPLRCVRVARTNSGFRARPKHFS
ncbi:hypothetical protein ALC56_10900 [Trachymyrmex septentrionalis]|uniref:Uncharacterized protein n=1 Tax=Trachymyrmex septentrionalis TaxID=34720 RepID=A0A195F436_9HYME|nr:hypothetical protein ALC56_10900 [Trachymyrmex septentrionalis]